MGRAIETLAGSEALCRFKVGRDRTGRWTVVDRQNRVGGLFVSQQAAVHFAMVESDYQPGAVWCAPVDEIEAALRPVAGRAGPAQHAA